MENENSVAAVVVAAVAAVAAAVASFFSVVSGSASIQCSCFESPCSFWQYFHLYCV